MNYISVMSCQQLRCWMLLTPHLPQVTSCKARLDMVLEKKIQKYRAILRNQLISEYFNKETTYKRDQRCKSMSLCVEITSNISLTVKVKSFHDFFAQQNCRHLEIANINCRTKHQNFRLKNLPDTGKFQFQVLKKIKNDFYEGSIHKFCHTNRGCRGGWVDTK